MPGGHSYGGLTEWLRSLIGNQVRCNSPVGSSPMSSANIKKPVTNVAGFVFSDDECRDSKRENHKLALFRKCPIVFVYENCNGGYNPIFDSWIKERNAEVIGITSSQRFTS